MTQIYSSEVVLKNTAEAVIVPLTDGVSSLNRVYEALIKPDVDPVTGQRSNYDYIREQIVQAHQHLERSEHVVSSGLKSLDENLARLIQDQGKLENDKRRTETHLANLTTQQASNQSLKVHFQGAVEQAGRNLESINKRIQTQKRRRRQGKLLRGIGVGLLAVPVAGWVAGGALAINGENRRSDASHAIREAEEEVRRYDAEVRNYERRVEEYQSWISQTYHDINQKNQVLDQMHKAIQEVKKQIEAVAEFQRKVRSAVELLGALSGKANVVERQTRRFILPEPVMRVLEDVMNTVEQITGNKILCNNDLPRLIHEMKENHQHLAAISGYAV
ncbi:cancer-associated 1 protein-like isoform X2 [Clarias magur]|uniref:Cancer-associated 1 protein-like isoform X2 n=1 Tax=Clarias magur TaxID=1594786 RepID=A0A8J4X1A7_CLAMG|nr:cancer-associated 1 protein-like isoform X2 [Clarias magur]